MHIYRIFGIIKAVINQKGFSPVIIIFAVLAILGIGFYAGISSQKPLVSNVELLQSPSSSTPTTNPTSKSTTTTSPTQNSVSTPTPTPAPAQTLTNTSNSNAPTFIKVSSPNGGESFKVGNSMHITWSSNNLYKSGSCVITLAYDNGSKSSAWVPVNTPNGYFDWKLTSESGGKQAKVDMQCYDSGSNGYNDQSDNYFIVSN